MRPIPRQAEDKDDLDVRAADREKNTLTHILAVSDYSLVKEHLKTLGSFDP